MLSNLHTQKKRPKNLNLLSVKFPMAAIMSVGHRASGILLFLILPYFLYLLQLSLSNEAGFNLAKQELHSTGFKLFALVIIWGLAHHLFAGIRYFLLDIDIGIEKHQAQKSAIVVNILGFLVTLLFAYLFFV
jgi:succinate dehydrogenase / fumarate reductase cytochrome b subunit